MTSDEPFRFPFSVSRFPMNRPPRILVLAVQTLFAEGGAERHVRRLADELRARGVEVDLVTMPLIERERLDLVRSALAWRSLDLSEAAGSPVDAVIATRFPSYAARHDRKVAWVIHQYRQAYDQFGTRYSDFTSSPEDRRTREVIAEIDRVGLSEARRVFANSANVAARLKRFNGIESEPLYHPPPLAGRHRQGPFGDYVLTVGRLDSWKRPDLVVRAMVHVPRARLVVVGRGPEEARLLRLASDLGIAERVTWLPRAEDDALIDLYAGARLVAIAPEGEDLGYVPLEAFLSGKPVVTTEDAGGPLEFVRDGETGFVVPPASEAIGAALRLAWDRTDLLEEMGRRGRERVSGLGWDQVCSALLDAAGLSLP
jgi:glycosyltransferase involved in cell wall biosynthesis